MIHFLLAVRAKIDAETLFLAVEFDALGATTPRGDDGQRVSDQDVDDAASNEMSDLATVELEDSHEPTPTTDDSEFRTIRI